MVLLRDAGISATPTAGEVAAGLAVHVAADFFWALVFFVSLARGRAGSTHRGC